MNPLTQKRSFNRPGMQRQRGFITLIVTVILLVLCIFVSMYTSKSVFFEQKIVGANHNMKDAFEAAEVGLAKAIEYLSEDADRDNDEVLDTLIFDTNGDGTPDADEIRLGDLTGWPDANDNRLVTVTMTDLSGDMNSIRIQSTALSNDGSATRTIIQVASTISPLPGDVNVPLTARNSVNINGSATIYNPEGNSTVWTGEQTYLGSNNSTATEVADPTDADYPGCMETSKTCNTIRSSNKLIVGSDVIEHDTNLAALSAAEFFERVFGMPMEKYKEIRTDIVTDPANADDDSELAAGKVIWVDGTSGPTKFTTSTYIGCEVSSNPCPDANLEPSILIIDGDVEITGNFNLFGMLFVTGSVSLSGNSYIEGAAIVSGDFETTAGGSLDIWYSSEVLNRITQDGQFFASSGAWKDF